MTFDGRSDIGRQHVSAVRRRPILMVVLLVGAALSASSAAMAKIAYVPIEFQQVSGTRPFVKVNMNGKPYLLMVHANAKLYVMTTHANAAAIGLTGLGKSSDYGIASDGHVSPLGRTSATLSRLEVGGRTVPNVKLSVFEIPQTPPIDGMIGMDWLRDQRVIVDFDMYRVGLPDSPTDATTEGDRLVKNGYVAHRLTWDPGTNGYFVMGTVNGKSARLGVSTVGENVIDSGFATRSGIELGPVISRNAGPKGALVDNRLVKRQVSFVVDGQRTPPAQPWSYDTVAYSSQKRTDAPHDDVFLGADFMLANQAVIDFGTGTLFLRSAQ